MEKIIGADKPSIQASISRTLDKKPLLNGSDKVGAHLK